MKAIKRALCRFGRWWYPASENFEPCCITGCMEVGSEVVKITYEGTGRDDLGYMEFGISGFTEIRLCIDHYTDRMVQANPDWRIDG